MVGLSAFLSATRTSLKGLLAKRSWRMWFSTDPNWPHSVLLSSCASTFRELMEEMAPASIVVATRYHTLICALRLGKPVIALSYAPKFAAALEGVGLSKFCQPAQDIDIKLLLSQFIEIESRQQELRRRIEAGNIVSEGRVASQFAELSSSLLLPDSGR